MSRLGVGGVAKSGLIAPGQQWKAKNPRDGRTLEILAVTVTGMVRTRVVACAGLTASGRERRPNATPSFMTATFLRAFEPAATAPATAADRIDWSEIREKVVSMKLSLTSREGAALRRAASGKPPLAAQPFLLDRILLKVRGAA